MGRAPTLYLGTGDASCPPGGREPRRPKAPGEMRRQFENRAAMSRSDRLESPGDLRRQPENRAVVSQSDRPATTGNSRRPEWLPFDPYTEILTPEAWPIPTRFDLTRDLVTAGGGANPIASPWLDFAAFNSPQVGARPAAAVLGREMAVAVYYDQATTAPTLTEFSLVLESMQLYAGGQPGITAAVPMATYDLLPQMTTLNGGIAMLLPIPPRIIRARLIVTATAVTGATRVVMALAFDKLRFRAHPQ